MKVLVVVAHPDDEVLGMGGTIAKLHDAGHEITLMIITDGSTSQYRGDERLEQIIAEKKTETANAATILGIDRVIYGGLPDMKLDMTAHIDVNNVIEKAVGEIEPDMIFTHFYADVNMDHQMVYKSVQVASRPVAGRSLKGVILFNTPSSTEWSFQFPDSAFCPNYYVDITDTAERKYKAMKEYATELREYPHPRSIEYLRTNDSSVGINVGLERAEAFMIARYIG